MRRLYKQIYLTIIASLLLVVLLGGAIIWLRAPHASPGPDGFELVGELIAPVLPPAADAAAQQLFLDRIHDRLKLDLALFDKDRQPVAAAGRPLPEPGGRETGGWIYGRGGPAWAIRLPDDRWLVARAYGQRWPRVVGLIGLLGAIAVAVGVCAYPLVRQLTRRLERLQAGVEKLGAGDLAARVDVEGRDEVAMLAESFNRAAARIEDLVGSHKLLLANASHELRTPLSRIRMGVELLKETAEPQVVSKRKAELERDIAELDALIDGILLSSRLDAVKGLDRREEIDLLALAAEEAARYEHCAVGGEPVTVCGDRALLRRMMRNLIDNAVRHGAPPVDVEVLPMGGQASITVSDHGPGVAAGDRERVFTPFFRLPGRGQSTGGGAGLGLTLVRQIANQHGGEAQWAGTADRPGTIRVMLPRSPADTPSPQMR